MGTYMLTHYQRYVMMTKVFMNVLAGYVTILTSQQRHFETTGGSALSTGFRMIGMTGLDKYNSPHVTLSKLPKSPRVTKHQVSR